MVGNELLFLGFAPIRASNTRRRHTARLPRPIGNTVALWAIHEVSQNHPGKSG